MKRSSSEKIGEKLQKFLEKTGEEALEIARETLTEEQKNIECKEVKEALNYFIDEYSFDKARPALPSIVCEAVGGKLEITKSLAAPLILISGAIGIHDDIISESKRKWGKPTVYGKYGRDIALLVGDALLLKGLVLLHKTENLSKEKLPTVPEPGGKMAKMPQKEQETPRQEGIIERVQRMMEERGARPLDMARKEILRGDMKSVEVQEALDYLVTERWQQMSHMLSPTVISLACEAVGGKQEKTIPIAASVILMAMGIRIHDDIIDKSKTKGAYTTIFGKFGTEIALAAGRILIMKGFTLLHEASRKTIPTEKIIRIGNIIKNSFFEFGSAEGLELNLRGNLDIAPQKYMQIIAMKASITEAEAQIGGIIGGGTQRHIEALGKYGRILGTILTIRDEFIDMFEIDELHHRMVNECLPLPILYALRNPEAKKKLIPILKKEKIAKKDMEVLVDTVFETKAIENLRRKIRCLQREAYSKLALLPRLQATNLLRFPLLAAVKDL